MVYVLLTTYKKFDSRLISNQWNLIQKLFKKYVEPLVGPLVGHASDGNNRRHKHMHFYVSKGTYGLDAHIFLMKVEVIDGKPMIMT